MGAAWCRHRAERAHDSKSPLDRVIVRCVDKFYSVDPNVTPVRIPKPTPGGVCSVSGNEGAVEELLTGSERREVSTPMRAVGGAGAWQKASLQVPSAEEPLVAKSAPASSTISSFVSSAAGRTPVPPPRRKRGARRPAAAAAAAPSASAVCVRPPPPPRPKDSPSASPPSPHLLSPPKPRPANTSTVSLPDWRDLKRSDEEEDDAPEQPPRPASASPRPQYLRPPSVTSVSGATLERVETYLRRCRSFGNMSSSGLVDRLSSIGGDTDSDEDPWEGVDDFDHAFHPHHGSPPHTPRSRVDRRKISSSQQSEKKPPAPGGRKRRSGATASTPNAASIPVISNDIFTSSGVVEESRSRFFISSPEDEWFNSEYHRDTTNTESVPTPSASSNPDKKPEDEIIDVKKELQSIIYDYNRTKKISVTSMSEVLPTQPVRTPKKKKISVASITPPPSPVSTDLEDEGVPIIPPSAVINGEENDDGNTHSTLLRLLRECQNIEGALEDLTYEESDMPRVHSALVQLAQNNRHPKPTLETDKQVTESLDSGLDVRGTLEHPQETPEQASIAVPLVVKNADSGVDEDDAQTGRQLGTSDSSNGPEATMEVGPPSKDLVVRRRRREAGAEDDGGSSSGRSSMTPSLSELEAALSDMLEKSAAAGDDDRASPLPHEQMAAIAPQALESDAVASVKVSEPSTPSGIMLIPKISVTPDSSPSVH